MLKSVKFFWKGITPRRIAASAALGVALGICSSGSAGWLIILSLCLILRTHICSLITGLALALIFKPLLRSLYEPTGKAILLSAKNFWQHILTKPVVCYLNLNVGHIMGNLAIAVLAGFITFLILLQTLKMINNTRAKT